MELVRVDNGTTTDVTWVNLDSLAFAKDNGSELKLYFTNNVGLTLEGMERGKMISILKIFKAEDR